MSARRNGGAEERPLDVIGVDEQGEQAYRWLLSNSGATAADVARAFVTTPGKIQRVLDAIETKGLITHSPQRPRRYIPVSPDIALKALALQHQERLRRLDGVIDELQEEAATHRRPDQEQMVELITSREAGFQTYNHIYEKAKHEILTLMRPPVLISRLELSAETDHRPQWDAIRRGVRFRSVADTGFLESPGVTPRIRKDMEAGEEVRVVPHLPIKMIMADHELALIPMSLQQLDSPSLLVRSSALLDALYALFEILWDRAAPLSFAPSGSLEPGAARSRFPEGAEDMLSLLVTGMNDKNIVHELDISRSTFTRRLAEIMKAMDARTRFQLGYLTALRLAG